MDIRRSDAVPDGICLRIELQIVAVNPDRTLPKALESGHMLLVDGHVHLYDCFDPPLFLDSAYSNLRAAAQALGIHPDRWSGCLCFTETSRDFAFSRLAAAGTVGSWRVARTGEPETLELFSGDRRLLIVAGHQIATAERLEVLAIGTCARVPDHLSIRETLARVQDLSALPIIPWAFGKWTASRGKVLRQIIEQSTPVDFAVGDNAGRPGLSLYPPLLTLAKSRGHLFLSGSDPLPMPAQAKRVGIAGFVVPDWQPGDSPAVRIKALLSSKPVHVRPFGAPNGLLRFVGMQVGMRLYSRMRRGAA